MKRAPFSVLWRGRDGKNRGLELLQRHGSQLSLIKGGGGQVATRGHTSFLGIGWGLGQALKCFCREKLFEDVDFALGHRDAMRKV
jgi:hypothetical protein